MKEGWKFRPFEKCLEKVVYTTKLQGKDYLKDGLYPIVSQEECMISGYWNKSEDVFHIKKPIVVFGDHTRIVKYIDFDFVLGADGVKILCPTDELNAKFLSYYLKWYKVPNLGYSRHYKLLKEIELPVPPLSEQQQIVEELDLLSGIIEKKKEQLKELDNLAQSIFYEMFGDPVANEKGWEVCQLGTKCDVTSFKRVLIEDVVEEGIPFIRGTELGALSKLTKEEDYKFTLYITPEHYERVKAISGVPKIGDLLIPSINSDGLIWILNTDAPRYYKDGRVLWVHVDNNVFTSVALKFIMSFMLKETYSTMASGATFAELKLFVLRELQVILPPLPLQQSFASKIEAIEKQKALIKHSITETETLFNSRMDYYFG